MASSFNQPELDMVLQTGTFAVATSTLTWSGGPIPWTVKNTNPTAVDGKPLPAGRPFSITNWRLVSGVRTADLNFATNIANVKEWDESVFNYCRQVKVKLTAAGYADVTLIVGTRCISHPLQQSLLSLVVQVADLVGSAVLLVLRWPLQFFRPKHVTAAVNEEVFVEAFDPRFDPEAAPMQSTPPPELEDENPSPKDQKRGAA